MRTTVDIDEDLLRMAKHLAQERRQSLGRTVSELIRKALQPAEGAGVRQGLIPTLPRKPGGQTVTAQAVKDLMELEP
jgi:hypothetical protein